MVVRSKAPLRISFGGRGTDVPPYPEERGGVVLSTTVDRYAYTTLIPREDDCISVNSLDYDIVAKFNSNGQLSYDEKLDRDHPRAGDGILCQRLMSWWYRNNGKPSRPMR